MYRAGSLMKIVKEISKYKLDLVAVKGVKWNRGGTEPAANTHISMERGMRIMN
jgi:hypothetical protein